MKKYLLFTLLFISINAYAGCIKIIANWGELSNLSETNDTFWDTYLIDLNRSEYSNLINNLTNGRTYYYVVKYITPNEADDEDSIITFVHPATYIYDPNSYINTEQTGTLVDNTCVLGLYNINANREFNPEDYDDLEGIEYERNYITFFFHYAMGMGDIIGMGTDPDNVRIELWDTMPGDDEYTYLCE